MVGDNGVGVSSDYLTGETKSIGVRLINRLVKQANGSIEILDGQGAMFKIALQNAKSEKATAVETT